ncbi:nuclear factor 7, brain-like isoform X2 [Sceloporus undulatus]|uniref:nuclear factor 7, brain-like isoform X2 n=1 Tax=Sceloporus undulatus TaxID=8520 RepID=UPI001C4D5572|nr:nuclear factor 7, brain-like isoform X2 [Sceloporus undulatus]
MAEAFHQDLTCSICLDLFVEPVLLSCEHCFCKKCVLSFWDSQERVSSCPECRAPCPDRQCTPSRLLGNLAKRAWDMRHETNSGILPNTTEVSEKEEREVETEERQHKGLCEVHGESLELFCTIDEIPICCCCINSSVHAGHSFVSLKDGAQSCKIELAMALEPLEIRIKELEELEGSQQEKIYSLKNLAASLRTNIEATFSELHQLLYQRQAKMLAELDKDEKDAHKDMADHLEQIQEKLSAAKTVVTEGKSFMELNNLSSFLLGVQPLLEKFTTCPAGLQHCSSLAQNHKQGNTCNL